MDESYPELRPFLAQFGLDIEAPDEMMPYDMDKELYYDSFYAVCGRILHTGKSQVIVGNIRVDPSLYNDLHINTRCPEPYFFLNTVNIIFPWALNEPMEDVVSPANVPSFLKRMWDRLLRRQRKDITPS